jgi:hypothetical protein
MAGLLHRLRRLRRSHDGALRGPLRIGLALAMMLAASVLYWASRDYAVVAPDWTARCAASPIPRATSTPTTISITSRPEQIDRDLSQLSRVTGRVRTYTVAGAWTRCRKSRAAMA